MSYVISGIKSKQISKPGENKRPQLAKKKRNEGCIFRRGSLIPPSTCPEEEEEESNLKLVARKEVNYYQRIYKFIKVDHIHSFFNVLPPPLSSCASTRRPCATATTTSPS